MIVYKNDNSTISGCTVCCYEEWKLQYFRKKSEPHVSNAILHPFKNYVYLDATYKPAEAIDEKGCKRRVEIVHARNNLSSSRNTHSEK